MTSLLNDPAAMRARFHELSDQRDAILARSGPLRAKRDQLVNDLQEKVKDLNAQIKAAEKNLGDIENERGALVRALKGKTGERPSSAA